MARCPSAAATAVVRPPDEPAGRELPSQPAIPREVSSVSSSGRHVHLQPRRSNEPNFGYPVDAALQMGLDSRNGVRGARVALTTVDPEAAQPVYAQLVLRRTARNRPRRRCRLQLSRKLRPQSHNAYNINRYAGDMIDGRFDGFNPSFQQINMVTSTSKSDYQGGTIRSAGTSSRASSSRAHIHSAGR